VTSLPRVSYFINSDDVQVKPTPAVPWHRDRRLEEALRIEKWVHDT